MSEFEEDRPVDAGPGGQLVVDLKGFEGPIDVLLTLARDQKVDLTHLSILDLADQYLAFIATARRLHLELAADYLVMAAWLAYLKSRILLPEPTDDDEPSGEELAEMLAFQLRQLEGIREVARQLMALPQLGRERFSRGDPEGIATIQHPVFDLSLYELLSAYGEFHVRQTAKNLRIVPTDLYSIDEALKRLRGIVGQKPDWEVLFSYLPPDLKKGIVSRSAIAATFGAGLELVKEGLITLQQMEAFGPIYIRAVQADEPGEEPPFS